MAISVFSTGNTLRGRQGAADTSVSEYIINNKSFDSKDASVVLESLKTTITPPSNGTAVKALENEITAKIFVPSNTSATDAYADIEAAITLLYNTLSETQTPINRLILSFGGLNFSDDEEDDENDDEDDDEENEKKNKLSNTQLFQVWKRTVDYGSSKTLKNHQPFIKEYGISEFSTHRLTTLLQGIDSLPTSADSNQNGNGTTHDQNIHSSYQVSVNHINAKDCCALPPSLIKISKERKIKLLAHHDPAEILTKTDAQDIAKSVGLNGPVKWKYTVKFTVFVKDRQVLTGNEYLVALEN